jgi:hypothetical protein
MFLSAVSGSLRGMVNRSWVIGAVMAGVSGRRWGKATI